MIGSRLRQAVPLPLALAFAAGLLGGAYGLHGCPRHSDAGHDGGDASTPVCVCLGSCHAGAAAAHPGVEAPRLPPALPPGAAPGRIARDVPPHATPAYFLPYALGPPPA